MALKDAMRSAINSASCKPPEAVPFITQAAATRIPHTLPISLSTYFVVYHPNPKLSFKPQLTPALS